MAHMAHTQFSPQDHFGPKNKEYFSPTILRPNAYFGPEILDLIHFDPRNKFPMTNLSLSRIYKGRIDGDSYYTM